jgi:hypothetical protein
MYIYTVLHMNDIYKYGVYKKLSRIFYQKDCPIEVPDPPPPAEETNNRQVDLTTSTEGFDL